MHCCLHDGTDPTHFNAMVTRYLPLLRKLGALERSNTDRVLGAVAEFWCATNPKTERV